MLKKRGEWWLPQSEDLGLAWFDNPRGERPEVIDAALRYVRNPEDQVALDIGAHVGTWTCELVRRFKHTHAFEPIMQNWYALSCNLSDRRAPRERVTLWLAAVGVELSSCLPHFMANGTMSSYCKPGELGGLPVIAVDDLPLGRVGLIKIDVEGMEYHVLRGAQHTITTHHPVLAIEWKPDRLNRWLDCDRKIETMLTQWGYVLERQMEIDRIYV